LATPAAPLGVVNVIVLVSLSLRRNIGEAPVILEVGFGSVIVLLFAVPIHDEGS